mgnify:CR=1 FL=1
MLSTNSRAELPTLKIAPPTPLFSLSAKFLRMITFFIDNAPALDIAPPNSATVLVNSLLLMFNLAPDEI